MRDGKRRGMDQVVPRHGITAREERRRLIGQMKRKERRKKEEEEEDEEDDEEADEDESEGITIFEPPVDERRGNYYYYYYYHCYYYYYYSLRKWLKPIIIGVLVCLCVSLLIINSLTYGQFNISPFGRSNNRQENEAEINSSTDIIPTTTVPGPGFVVRTRGCRIPAFEVLDSSIKQYFADISPFQCQAGTHLPLVNSDLKYLLVDPAAKSHFYNDSDVVDCCWREFWRAAQNDNKITYDKTCQSFSNSTKIEEGVEFVKIECRRNGYEIYKDYHAFVPRKLSVENRCNISSHRDIKDSNRLSVLILGLDAVSRLNFHRTMPDTVKALENLKAVEMLGYNKVADNTFPNMIPVLTGLSEAELTKLCWTSKKKPFDDCPFIWQNFSSAGYRTILGEDACSMSIFNYLKSGFENPPTDYYLRPYCIAAENEIGNTHKLNADLCVGTRKTFDGLLSYGKKVAKEFSNDKYFALFWQASLTHDFVTYPKFGDKSYSEFISDIDAEGILNKTALIVMSDHGIRWGSFRQTYQGHVEESLPFVFIVLPEWWREKYPTAWANLRRNSRSLTTPFDLHETLLHILNEDQLGVKIIEDRSKWGKKRIPRGLSWFLPIPDHRDCGMAGIPGHWCMCHLSQNTSLNDPLVRISVGFLLQELNSLFTGYPQCSKLELKRVLDAKIWSESKKPDNKKGGKDPPTVDYTVTIQTEPGDAIFEATVRHKRKDSSKKLVGSISRLNLYGKQSSCVDDFKMRLYCYCSRR